MVIKLASEVLSASVLHLLLPSPVLVSQVAAMKMLQRVLFMTTLAAYTGVGSAPCHSQQASLHPDSGKGVAALLARLLKNTVSSSINCIVYHGSLYGAVFPGENMWEPKTVAVARYALHP